MMKDIRRFRTAALIVVLPLAACTTWRWPGSPHPALLPPTLPAKLKAAAYPADLGSEAIDVSAYPRRIRTDYKVYARVCSKCHTLARANYSQHVERAWWTLYITQMRARAAWEGSSLSNDDVRAIFDFLEHDSRVRKGERAIGFAQTNEELARRFNAEMDSRMQSLQKGPPILNGQ